MPHRRTVADALIQKHPQISGASVDVRSGWFRLCDELITAILARSAEHAPETPVVFDQIKSDFAVLRCYLDAPVPCEDLIRRASLRSALTCEYCGAIGRLRMQRPLRRVRTTCEECESREKLGPWVRRPLPSSYRVTTAPRPDGFVDVTLVVLSQPEGSLPHPRSIDAHPDDAALAATYLLDRL